MMAMRSTFAPSNDPPPGDIEPLNANIHQQLTFLGLCAMGFYGAMFATGNLSIEVMPQFMISSVIFISSGQILKKFSRGRDDEEQETKKTSCETDWAWLTLMTNWAFAMLILGGMAIFLMKPADISITDVLHISAAHDQYFAHFVP